MPSAEKGTHTADRSPRASARSLKLLVQKTEQPRNLVNCKTGITNYIKQNGMYNQNIGSSTSETSAIGKAGLSPATHEAKPQELEALKCQTQILDFEMINNTVKLT